MNSDWVHGNLADACQRIDYGLTASARTDVVGPKFLRITDIVPGHIDWDQVPFVEASEAEVDRFRLDHGDIVIARTGASTGVSAFVHAPPEAVFASYLVRLRANNDFEPRFLAYYLKSEQFWGYMRGVLGDKSAQPNASAATMTQAPLSAPRSKKEQRAIAETLGALDDKIELNRQMNETLEEITHTIFRAQFGPHARLDTSDNGKPLPRGLERKRLGDIFDVRIGRTPPRKESIHFLPAGGGIPWLSIKSMGNLRVYALDTDENLTERAVQMFRVPVVPEGTVLLSFKLTVGRVAIAAKDMATNEAIAHFLPRDDTPVGAAYTYCFLKQLDYDSLGSTSSIARAINSKIIKSIKMTLPSAEEHSAFEAIARPIFQRILTAEIEVRVLTELRDALLPKLISGELRIPDAERIVSEVT